MNHFASSLFAPLGSAAPPVREQAAATRECTISILMELSAELRACGARCAPDTHPRRGDTQNLTGITCTFDGRRLLPLLQPDCGKGKKLNDEQLTLFPSCFLLKLQRSVNFPEIFSQLKHVQNSSPWSEKSWVLFNNILAKQNARNFIFERSKLRNKSLAAPLFHRIIEPSPPPPHPREFIYIISKCAAGN